MKLKYFKCLIYKIVIMPIFRLLNNQTNDYFQDPKSYFKYDTKCCKD